MRSRLIAVCLLLAVSGAMQSAAMAVESSPPAGPTHTHAGMFQHACCPQGPGAQTAQLPTQAPGPDMHRCCFLRGPQSSLPMGAAAKEKLAPASRLLVEAVVLLTDSSTHSLLSCRDARAIPPLAIQMSVVRRN
jgi:hypothetical protein